MGCPCWRVVNFKEHQYLKVKNALKLVFMGGTSLLRVSLADYGQIICMSLIKGVKTV